MSSTRAKIVIAVLVSPFVLFGVGNALALNSNSGTGNLPVGSPSGARIDTADSPSYIAGKSWADLGAEEFASLPVGTQIVDCGPNQKRMPPDVMFTGGVGGISNPGRHLLIDGRCAFDPSAIPKAFRQDMVDGTPFTGMEWIPIMTVGLASLPDGVQIVNCWGDIKQLPSGVMLQVGKDFTKEHPNFHFLNDGRCALSPNANSQAAQATTGTYDLQWFATGLAGTPSVGSNSCFVGDPLKNHCDSEMKVIVPGILSPTNPLPSISSAG